MYSALFPVDVARDAVAAQFDYGEPLEIVVAAEPARRPHHTRYALSTVLHRIADSVAPDEYSPAH